MTLPSERRFAGVLAHHNGEVILVRESHGRWGQVQSWNFEVEVDDPTLRVQDPDRLVQEARWFPVDQAIAVLRLLPYRPLAEPAIATLSVEAAAGRTHWTFASPEADPHVGCSEWGIERRDP